MVLVSLGAWLALSGPTAGGPGALDSEGRRTVTPDAVPRPVPGAPGPEAPGGLARPSPSTAADRWAPRGRVTWQWQLSGELDLTVPVEVYDVDLFTTTAKQIAQLHARDRRVICYLSAGTFEPGRPDSADFLPDVIGAPLQDWPDERWLDVRRLDVLLPLMAARMDLCAAKGFDAVEPDNVDGWSNASGFDLTGDDQLTYNRELARLAHERGLAVALKNDVEQAAVLEPLFDFAINEECVAHGECQLLLPFVRAGKAVLHVEYDLEPEEFCEETHALGFSSMQKSFDLDATRKPC